ncbi:MAG TPA: response regulator transcription factor [Bryobacteraceae bacterium]|jgi:DNA-binding NarL/FixJ family response regulator|nr:response regulator transcription factor [Bryobacteraceae bacterium]
MQRRPHLLIADVTLTAQCLQRLLEYEFPGVEIIPDGQALLHAVATLRPDLLLLDFTMPGLNGFEAIRQLRDASAMTKIIVVTMRDEPECVAEALGSGASGYVLKSCTVSELVTAIRGVLDGHSYVTQPLGERVASSVTNRTGRPSGKGLTLRQREVLQLVAQGRTAKEIGNALSLSVKTAVFHKMAIMDKLGLRTTADLTRYALQHGILSPLGQLESPLPSTSIPLATTATSA